MKKYFTLLAVTSIFLVSTSLEAAASNGNNSSSEKKVALAILIKQVDREIINELQLNEMQYIQLRTLNKKYKEEVAIIKATTETAAYDSKVQELNNKYFAELNSVLTDKQLTTYTKNRSLALN
ncbi:hypothetical protein ACFSRY_08055 [Pontibacter locisalis]|uniref:Uncharacterized protein n=1 Tax=Pontibacter locisalis TaxID=1719035 RepID=A0ABW5IKI6_9BACT